MKMILSLVLVSVLVLSSPAGEQRRADGRDKKASGSAETKARSAQKDSDRPPRDARQDQETTGKTEPKQKSRRTEVKTREPEPLRETGHEYRPPTEPDPWERIQGREGQTGRVGTDHKRVFENVRDGLKSGRMNSLSDLLAPKVQVSLRGGESGYFSSSQAYYVLENYLQENRFSNVEFTTMEQSGDMPYATGKADFDHNGVHDAAQVYVSLSQVGERWVISQIKIY